MIKSTEKAEGQGGRLTVLNKPWAQKQESADRIGAGSALGTGHWALGTGRCAGWQVWLAGWLSNPCRPPSPTASPPCPDSSKGTTWAGCQREAGTARRYYVSLDTSGTPVSECALSTPGTNRTRSRGHTGPQRATFEGRSYTQKPPKVTGRTVPGLPVTIGRRVEGGKAEGA